MSQALKEDHQQPNQGQCPFVVTFLKGYGSILCQLLRRAAIWPDTTFISQTWTKSHFLFSKQFLKCPTIVLTHLKRIQIYPSDNGRVPVVLIYWAQWKSCSKYTLLALWKLPTTRKNFLCVLPIFWKPVTFILLNPIMCLDLTLCKESFLLAPSVSLETWLSEILTNQVQLLNLQMSLQGPGKPRDLAKQLQKWGLFWDWNWCYTFWRPAFHSLPPWLVFLKIYIIGIYG